MVRLVCWIMWITMCKNAASLSNPPLQFDEQTASVDRAVLARQIHSNSALAVRKIQILCMTANICTAFALSTVSTARV